MGGAVRDKLLGLPVTDRDWVVVGASIDDMLANGFKQVGKDFPVFLHPDTHEQYALARTERKIGPGHHGFDFDSSASVTLEQDLMRRDLTVNAIAETADGKLIDPCGGLQDLAQHRLRHTSDAFSEDPLRVIRVARFAARFYHLNFSIAAETMALMQQVVNDGELQTLARERIWHEMELALVCDSPSRFIQVLHDCGALAVILPELDRLFGLQLYLGVSKTLDAGELTLRCLQQARLLSDDPAVLYATLMHDIDRKDERLEVQSGSETIHVTSENAVAVQAIESRQGTDGMDMEDETHAIKCTRDKASAPNQREDLLGTLKQRLPLPRECAALSQLVCRHYKTMQMVESLKPTEMLNLLESLDTLRRPERMEKFLLVCDAIACGRNPEQAKGYPAAGTIRTLQQALLSINTAAVLKAAGEHGLQNPKQVLRQARLEKLTETSRSLCNE